MGQSDRETSLSLLGSGESCTDKQIPGPLHTQCLECTCSVLPGGFSLKAFSDFLTGVITVIVSFVVPIMTKSSIVYYVLMTSCIPPFKGILPLPQSPRRPSPETIYPLGVVNYPLILDLRSDAPCPTLVVYLLIFK